MERRFSSGERGELLRQLSATAAALNRNHAARARHQAAQARHDMRTWQVERRKRTRHLIELGGLIVKSGVVDLTGDDLVTILGALLDGREAQKRSGRTRADPLEREGERGVRRGSKGEAQTAKPNCAGQ